MFVLITLCFLQIVIVLYGCNNNHHEIGYPVSGAGDIKRDNFDDLIIGAFVHNSSTGRVYIYYGGIIIDGSPDIILDGDAVDSRFGYLVSGAGDVNGDNFDDVVVEAFSYSEGDYWPLVSL